MSGSDEDIKVVATSDRQKTFVDILKDVSVLLNKSQLPRVKERKSEAGQLMITEFQKKTGLKMTKDQDRCKENCSQFLCFGPLVAKWRIGSGRFFGATHLCPLIHHPHQI
jgi:hypothetical protein